MMSTDVSTAVPPLDAVRFLETRYSDFPQLLAKCRELAQLWIKEKRGDITSDYLLAISEFALNRNAREGRMELADQEFTSD